jgi:hypothetical protein
LKAAISAANLPYRILRFPRGGLQNFGLRKILTPIMSLNIIAFAKANVGIERQSLSKQFD